MNQFEAQDVGALRRKVSTRDKRVSPDDPHKIVFNFKYYLPNTLKKNKQSFKSWEKDKLFPLFYARLTTEGKQEVSV
jgi:hypothetical protein